MKRYESAKSYNKLEKQQKTNCVNVKNIKRRERDIKSIVKYFSTRAHKENMDLKIKKRK